VAGEGEEKLRSVFAEATRSAEKESTVLFIDEVDVLCPQRSTSASSPSNSPSTDRLTSQLLSLMDGVVPRGRLLVIAATNHPHSIDAALRRPGRFDREVEIPPPQAPEREDILRWYMRSMQIEGVDVQTLARRCIGYVGADLEGLCREAGLHALHRSMVQVKAVHGNLLELKGTVNADDFEYALTRVPASSQRNSLSYLPSAASPYSFASLGGLSSIIAVLQQSISWPFLYPDTFKRLNLRPPRGILLHGAPGCGKV
jgi:transitional endoplasmic reticulum ATPase